MPTRKDEDDENYEDDEDHLGGGTIGGKKVEEYRTDSFAFQ